MLIHIQLDRSRTNPLLALHYKRKGDGGWVREQVKYNNNVNRRSKRQFTKKYNTKTKATRDDTKGPMNGPRQRGHGRINNESFMTTNKLT